MYKPLNKLVEIRSGHAFRGSISDTPEGDVRVLQIKDIKACATINEEGLPRIRWTNAKAPTALKKGVIVMPARGEHYNAATYIKQDDSDKPVVATNQLFILRSRSDAVTTEYLCWYLNQASSQHYFKTHASGTSIPMLKKHSLGALQVKLPPLDIQHKIVSIYALWLQEKQLNEKLQNNREQMLHGIFQQLMKL